MLTLVNEAAVLIRDARREAGLSQRALSFRADVSYTTICRIERGRIDPTIGTVQKVLSALGHELEFSLRPSPYIPQLGELTDAWSTDRSGQEQPDWTRLRAFLDYLARNPQLSEAAIRARIPSSGSTFIDNLLAGVAEKVADDAGASRPAWTKHIGVLQEVWRGMGTPRMRESAEATTPPQLAARNIFIPVASLWRPAPS